MDVWVLPFIRPPDMNFQPLQDNDPDRLRPADFGLLVIRCLVAVVYAYYQLAGMVRSAVDHVWSDANWGLVGQFQERGFPASNVLAVAFVALQSATLLGCLLGFLTRFNALVFALMTGFALLSALDLSPTLNPQGLALYLAVFAGLACGGGGRISLDHLLAGRRARRQAV